MNFVCMVGRMGGGLYFSVEIELKMSKIPPFTYLNVDMNEVYLRIIYQIGPFHFCLWKAPMFEKKSMELPMADTHTENKNPWYDIHDIVYFPWKNV